MTRPIVNEFNAQTQELVVREMNDAEFAQYEIDNAAHEARLLVTPTEEI